MLIIDNATANYWRADSGLRGYAPQDDFDWYIYCGNEQWSDEDCATRIRVPTVNGWSHYWSPKNGPVGLRTVDIPVAEGISNSTFL